MKKFETIKALLANGKDLRCEKLSFVTMTWPSEMVCATKQDHGFDLLPLDSAVRHNQGTDNIDVATRDLPFPYFFSGILRCLFWGILDDSATKSGKQPINQTFLGVSNGDKGLIAKASTVLPRAFGNNNGAFSIDDSRQISTLSDRILSFFRHGTPLVKSTMEFTRSDINLHPQRLTVATPARVK